MFKNGNSEKEVKKEVKKEEAPIVKDDFEKQAVKLMKELVQILSYVEERAGMKQKIEKFIAKLEK